MAFRVLAAGLLLVGLSACAGAHAKQPPVGQISPAVAWSPDGRRIAWDENERIWTARPDMSEAHPITPPIDALGPIVWVTKRELVYWADFRLYASVRGRGSWLISEGGDSDFSVGGNRTRIATGDPPCSTGCSGPVVVTDLVGHVVARVSPRTQNIGPSLARSGRLVAFDRILCDRGGRCEHPNGIWTATIPRGTPRRVAPPGCCPRISPDGKRIAFVAMRRRSSLRLIPATGGAGSGRFLATLGGTYFIPPKWSPDSRRIAAVTEVGRLLIVNVSAGRVTASTSPAIGAVLGFAWSPDSSKLLVVARPPVQHACASLWLVSAQSAAARPLRRCG